MNKINFPRKKVYFEKQSNDRLCGVHCLNNLLQGPFFDAVDLSEIALRLDEIESSLIKSDFRVTIYFLFRLLQEMWMTMAIIIFKYCKKH